MSIINELQHNETEAGMVQVTADMVKLSKQTSDDRSKLKPLHVKRSAGELMQIREPAYYLDTLADKVHKVPKMVASDKVKCKGLLLALGNAHRSAGCHLANTLHNVKSKRNDWEKIDRIGALANAIDKFGRLNPKVLKGGDALKAQLIDLAWIAYADLEANGYDNAHFIETQIPMDERMDIADDGCNVGSGFNNEEYKRELRYMA